VVQGTGVSHLSVRRRGFKSYRWYTIMIYVQKSNLFDKTAVRKDIKNAVFSGKIYSLLEIIYFSCKRFLTQLISSKMSH
jgi:hypothetical protein